jgi:hypothetical protein
VCVSCYIGPEPLCISRLHRTKVPQSTADQANRDHVPRKTMSMSGHTPAPINCWEFTKCGREPGGERAADLGVCPVTTQTKCDGVNRGTNAGRACWLVSGTLCGGEVQGHFAQKLASCADCNSYKQVHDWTQTRLAWATRHIQYWHSVWYNLLVYGRSSENHCGDPARASR